MLMHPFMLEMLADYHRHELLGEAHKHRLWTQARASRSWRSASARYLRTLADRLEPPPQARAISSLALRTSNGWPSR